MVVPKNVQGAVHHQSQHLFPYWHTLPLRVGASDLGTNVDVTDNSTTFPRSAKPE
jgi:hypothetical protein